MLCNHVWFCSPVLHLPGGTKDSERGPQQDPSQRIQGIADTRPLFVIHVKNTLAFVVEIINTHAQAAWGSDGQAYQL